jgi:hypothetical protein
MIKQGAKKKREPMRKPKEVYTLITVRELHKVRSDPQLGYGVQKFVNKVLPRRQGGNCLVCNKPWFPDDDALIVVIELKLPKKEGRLYHIAGVCEVCGWQQPLELARAAGHTFTADELNRSLPKQDG